MKLMPLSVVMDERICTGYEYAKFYQSFNKYLKHPEWMENGAVVEKEADEELEYV